MTQPCIVRDLIVPGLIGLREAKKLKMVIRPVQQTVETLPIEDERKVMPSDLVEQPKLPVTSKTTEQQRELENVMRSKISSDLSEEKRNTLWETLMKHRKVWLQPTFGRVKTPAEFIATGRPVKDKLRPQNAEMKRELDKQIDELLALKVIRPSKSPWASSPVFVRKANGSWRMAIDYRRVNKKLKTDGYPVPLLWEQLQLAGGHIYYARLDGKSGFFNVPLTESSKELTAFNTHRGLYEYNVLPFGIKNSPGEFQRVMDTILSDMYGSGVLCYIDDIVIYADEYEEWINLIDKVFEKLWNGGVFVEPKKCEFGANVIPVLGHLLSINGIMPNPKKVEAIKSARAPNNKKELMSFLGLVGFIRRFVPKYSERTMNLTALLKKKVVFNWTEDCQKEFEELKDVITATALLSVPNSQGPYVLLCDASNLAIGSVLAQLSNKELRLLEFSSHKFSQNERNWSTREKEAYAIRWSVQRFEPYIKGAKVYVLTDHVNLQWMDSTTSGKIQRWALYLQQFDLHVKAISGIDNGMADWLSRSVDIKDEAADAEIDLISTPVHYVSVLPTEIDERQVYSTSPYLPTWDQWLEASKDVPAADKDYVKRHTDNLWYSKPENKLYVPPCLRDSILYYFHASPYGGHFGISKTYRRLNRWFYWPKQKASVVEYIHNYLPCKRTGPPSRRYLRQVLSRTEPFQLISLDHVGPRVWSGKKLHYLVMIDHFSRYIVIKPVSSTTTEETVKTLHEEWVIKFRAPEAVLVDRGRAFMSNAFQSYVCDYLAADLVYAGAGYPQGNALNESVHRGIEASITARKQHDASTKCDEILADAVLAYNSTPHSSTGQSPYFLLFGKEMTLPGLQRFKEELPETMRRARIKEARKMATMRAILNQDEGLCLYKPTTIEVGEQIVFYLKPQERERLEAEGDASLLKYSPQWSIPMIVSRVGESTVDILIGGGKSVTVSRRLIRKVGKNIPPSLQDLSNIEVAHEPARYKSRPSWLKGSPPRKRMRVSEILSEIKSEEIKREDITKGSASSSNTQPKESSRSS